MNGYMNGDVTHQRMNGHHSVKQALMNGHHSKMNGHNGTMNGTSNGHMNGHDDMYLAGKYDHKYNKYEVDVKGWKKHRNGDVDQEDRGLALEKRIKKDGIEQYAHSKIKVAVFGLGRIGTIHFEKLMTNPRVKVVTCAESCAERANYVEYRWRLPEDIKIMHPNESSNIFNDPEIDAVVICTPTQTHEALVMEALRAGKAVLCEKPLAHTAEGIKNCYSLADEMKLPMLCAFNRRFDPSFKQIRDRVRKGEVGQVHVIKTCSRDSPLPSIEYLKTSGGIFHDCAVHDIDLICWVLGEFPISVSCQAHAHLPQIREINDFDTVAIVMKFPSGAVGLIDLSRHAVYGYDQRLEVFGSKGMLTSNEMRPTGVVHHTQVGATAVPMYFSFASRYSDAYSDELDHFLNCVEGREEVSVTGYETLAVDRVATACEEAARSGKTIALGWGTTKEQEELRAIDK